MKKIAMIVTFLLLGYSFAEMVITKTDGSKMSVDINKEDIIAIEFLSDITLLENQKLILNDTFDNGSFENWSGSSSNKGITDGIVHFSCTNHTTFQLNKKIPSENVIVEWYGAADKNGFHGSLGPYEFNIGGWNNSASGYSGPDFPFKKIITGKVYEPNKFQIYKLERIGNKIKATVDDRVIFDEILTVKNKDPEGIFKFNTYYGTLKVDWIKIYRP
ncbi:MAG: hypothetical protein JXR69_02780 [Candidatus Delongbacteria bacterium]|nr:hypothetical protein [Candidatus Delongbacteria bacterium]